MFTITVNAGPEPLFQSLYSLFRQAMSTNLTADTNLLPRYIVLCTSRRVKARII